MDIRKKRPRVRFDLVPTWEFDSDHDGTILFYPHGWGRAYIVPSEQKRREIEQSLSTRLNWIRFAADILGALGVGFAAIFFVTITPPFCLIVQRMPGWPNVCSLAAEFAVTAAGLWTGALLAMRFFAEVAKADLDKAAVRRRFTQWLKERATGYDSRQLWLEACLFVCLLASGVWLLWPSRSTIMGAAHIDSRLLPTGLVFIALGGSGILLKTWQVSVRRNNRTNR